MVQELIQRGDSLHHGLGVPLLVDTVGYNGVLDGQETAEGSGIDGADEVVLVLRQHRVEVGGVTDDASKTDRTYNSDVGSPTADDTVGDVFLLLLDDGDGGHAFPLADGVQSHILGHLGGRGQQNAVDVVDEANLVDNLCVLDDVVQPDVLRNLDLPSHVDTVLVVQALNEVATPVEELKVGGVAPHNATGGSRWGCQPC